MSNRSKGVHKAVFREGITGLSEHNYYVKSIKLINLWRLTKPPPPPIHCRYVLLYYYSGRVINVETVSLKIARDDWSDNIRLDPCECKWYDEYNIHQITFIRLFYLKVHGYHGNQVIGVYLNISQQFYTS